jgi:hypothetical protein
MRQPVTGDVLDLLRCQMRPQRGGARPRTNAAKNLGKLKSHCVTAFDCASQGATANRDATKSELRGCREILVRNSASIWHKLGRHRDSISCNRPTSVGYDASDRLSFVHQVKRLVDVRERHRVRDHRVALDLAIHVPVDDLGHVGASTRATEGRAARSGERFACRSKSAALTAPPNAS